MKKFNSRWIYLTALIIIIVFIAATQSKKISELTELTDLDTGDWLVVVDSSASATRKLNTSRLNPYAASVGFDALAIDTLTVSDSANIGDLIVGDSLYVGDDLVVGDTLNVTSAIELSGGVITSFSTDTTFADNEDVVVPTEKAVKSYITSQIDTIDADSLYVSGDAAIGGALTVGKNADIVGEGRSATIYIEDSLYVGGRATLIGTTKIDSVLILIPADTTGMGITAGTIMMSDSDDKLYCWDGSTWNALW